MDDKAPQFDTSVKAATDRVPTGSNLIPDAIPQERFTGDVLRGYGPRRGNLERLLRYWRPIMRKPGGFRRCRVILADHPELYPLDNLCAWLHHETTGLWPNEGCHHPTMKNCRRKLKRVVRGSLWSDAEFNRRMDKIPGNGKSMRMDDLEMNDMGEVTDDDVDFANKVLGWFVDQEPDFIKVIVDDESWELEGEDEDGNVMSHPWDRTLMASAGKSDCGCGCKGHGSCGDKPQTPASVAMMTLPESVTASLADLQAKVSRVLNSRNADRISQAIAQLTEAVGNESTMTMKRDDAEVHIKADSADLLELYAVLSPVVDYHAMESEFDGDGMVLKGVSDDAYEAIEAVVRNLGHLESKGDSYSDEKGLGSLGGFVPRDGDGDGLFSPRPGAPDKTPVPISMMWREKPPTVHLPGVPRRRDDNDYDPNGLVKARLKKATDSELREILKMNRNKYNERLYGPRLAKLGSGLTESQFRAYRELVRQEARERGLK